MAHGIGLDEYNFCGCGRYFKNELQLKLHKKMCNNVNGNNLEIKKKVLNDSLQKKGMSSINRSNKKVDYALKFGDKFTLN